MDNVGDLGLLLRSRHPLIAARARDETRLLAVIREAATGLGVPMWTWSMTKGLARDGHGPQYGTTDPHKALAFIAELQAGVFVLVDAHHVLSDPAVVRRVKELAQQPVAGRTVVLAGSEDVPGDLQGLALPWTLRPPSTEELSGLVRRTVEDLRARGFPVLLDDGGIASLVDALRGLSVAEAEHLIQRAVLRDGELDESDLGYVRSAKAELLGAGGVLELIEADAGTLDDVGGMDGLKEWLRVRGRALGAHAAAFGLDPPRGVLLTGVPGCGKSFVAKTLARTWGMPLVLLDPGRLYGPYVGESERRLDESLRTIDALAPCVLWIDEIEKGFASQGTDGGVSQRVLGTFLRWMQDRPAGSFVIATANDVRALPPEFLRKGRFDEIFFVDLPGPGERAAILRHHLAKRGHDPAAFDLERLAALADGFSGAELEAAVVGALYRAFADEAAPTGETLEAEITGTVPLSRARAADIGALRGWAAEHATAA